MKTKTLRRRAVSKSPGTLKSKLIRIGNSRGVRLPKAIIEQVNLTDQVEISVRGNRIILESARRSSNPREGWDELMKKAVALHGNELTEEDREWLDAPLDTELKPAE